MRIEITEGPHQLQSGQYGKWRGTWYAQPPCEADLTANLERHEVHEHADGSISVRPSIWVEAGALGTWHGFLWAGKWSLNPPVEGLGNWPSDAGYESNAAPPVPKTEYVTPEHLARAFPDQDTARERPASGVNTPDGEQQK